MLGTAKLQLCSQGTLRAFKVKNTLFSARERTLRKLAVERGLPLRPASPLALFLNRCRAPAARLRRLLPLSGGSRPVIVVLKQIVQEVEVHGLTIVPD